MPTSPAGWSVTRIRLTAGTVAALVATFLAALVARNVFEAAHRTVGWVVACTVVALLLTPVIERLSTVMPRGLAIALTMITLAVLVVTVLVGVFTNVRTQVDKLSEQLPAAAERIEADSPFSDTAREFGLTERTQSFVDALDKRLSQGDTAISAAGTAPTFFVNAILVVFFVVFGERTIRAAFRQIADEERRARVERITWAAITRGRSYVLASLAQGLLIGLFGGLVAWRLELPAPAAVGLLLGAFALVPYVGVLLGAAPILMLTAGFATSWFAWVAMGAVVLQGVSAVVTARVVNERSVRVGPAVVVLAALLGFAVYGPGGAFYGAALAVFGVAALDAAAAEAASESSPVA